jgi:hypothetical protein
MPLTVRLVSSDDASVSIAAGESAAVGPLQACRTRADARLFW